MEPVNPDDMASLRAKVDQLSKQLELQKDLNEFRQKVDLELSRLKWIGTTIGMLIAVLGFFGIKAWQDLTNTAQKALTKQISDMSTAAFDLSRGFVLADSRRYQEAIPYLTSSYERNHYDESVDSALIDALINEDDYASALRIVQELKRDDRRYRSITNPRLYNNIGRVLLYYGLDNPTLLDEAGAMLDRSLRTFPTGDYSSKFPMFNLFRLYVVRGDYNSALDYLKDAYRIDKGYGKESYAADAFLYKLGSKMPLKRREAAKLIAQLPH